MGLCRCKRWTRAATSALRRRTAYGVGAPRREANHEAAEEARAEEWLERRAREANRLAAEEARAEEWLERRAREANRLAAEEGVT